MPVRHLPVAPDLDQLKRQAKDLLRAIHAGDPAAVAELREFHPATVDPPAARLADAQLVLARSYQSPSWPRLVQAVHLVNAIWADDLDTVRDLITKNPKLVHEHALVRPNSNWGPPMSYAANLGRNRIIKFLHRAGATDLEYAAGRAALQGKVETVNMLYEMAGRPPIPDGALDGPAYTLSTEGTAALFALGAGTSMLFALGARAIDQGGKPLAPVDVVLQTDGRNPQAKHAILEIYVQQGIELPDTPTMALHRGRIDLLEDHLQRDPNLLNRRFRHGEIYPAEMGCGDPIDAVSATPLDGTTLLHMCVEYDEIEIARWLIDRGADVNARAHIGRNGYGGYTPLFNTVVSQPNFWMNYKGRGPFEAPFTELLLDHGADPNVRASLWKRFGPGHDSAMTRHEFRDVTALSYGRQAKQKIFVSEVAMRLIEAAGGVE